MSDDEIVPLLHEENIEPASNVCHPSPIRPQRSLPPGKTYHIFISYSSHDQPYVLRLKTVLEGLGFKCMLADHDFSYGVSVMQNIETTIQTCHKLLFVVSQHFLQSAMCDKEVDMAHKYAADIRRNDFMLVLRLDESRMPLKLDYMTYINGVELEVKDVGRKVEKAFDGFADVPLSQNINGLEILRKQPTSKSPRQCCSSSYELTDLSQFETNTLFSWSVEESQECYRKIMEDANDHFLLKRYAVFVCGHKLMCFIVLLTLGIATSFASLYILLSIFTGDDTSIFTLILICILLIGLIIGLYTACIVYLFHQMMRRLHSIVRNNTDCKSQNYLVIPRQHRNDIFISFIYYDIKPCWNYLEQRAREYWPDDSEEDIAKKCNEELVTTILSSFKGLDLNPIPQAAPIRHNTYQNRCCLCLIAQSSWTNRKSALNVIPEQCMENYQNEETCVMKIAESETDHETFVKQAIGNEYFESTEENDETSVMKILCKRQESISSYSHGVGAVSGSPLLEAGSGLPLAEAVGCTSLRGAEGGTSLTEAASGLPLTEAEVGTSLTGTLGGSSLAEAEGGSLLDSNIDRWYGDMCETRVRGEAPSTQQPQVSHELITLEKNLVKLTDSEMSTSLNDLEEAVPLQSGDEELQWFRGEHVIDEATHAKVPR